MNRRSLLKFFFLLPLPLIKLLARWVEAAEVTLDLAPLEAPWSSLEFQFPQAEGPRTSIPAIAVRLPNNGMKKPEEAVFVASRVCPHEGCELLYFKDPAQALQIFRVPTENPVLGCPCHLSVFDLKQEGKVINGPAPRPPFRFGFRVEGKKLVVTDLK